jgi:hypothetical protein
LVPATARAGLSSAGAKAKTAAANAGLITRQRADILIESPMGRVLSTREGQFG